MNSGYYLKFFQKVKKLGSGSYGTVHLVKHVMHDISLGYFAIKIICVGDKLPRLIEIVREVRALQRLHHRNVIDYKHSWLEMFQPAISGPLVPCLFILMEYADCGNVMDYVLGMEQEQMSEHEIWTIMFETCMGLQHLHEYGIVHRDIKPGNLLMTSLHTRHRIDFDELELYDTNYRIVVSDLGQSDFMNSHERGPRTGNTGTLGFAAPELIFKNEWDEAVDIWSLGHLLYFLAFGRWPYAEYECDDEMQLYEGIISGKYKLCVPKQNGYRSDKIIEIIDELCCIDETKRPSLSWIICEMSDILRLHQYETNTPTDEALRFSFSSPERKNRSRTPPLVGLENETKSMRPRSKSEEHLLSPRLLALPPPSRWKPDLSRYPVIKYVPKKRKKQMNKRNHFNNFNANGIGLRRRGKRKMSLLSFDDQLIETTENESERMKDLVLFDEEKKVVEIEKNQLEMTMFVMLQKPIAFVLAHTNIGTMSLCMMIKMELMIKYVYQHSNGGYALQIYIGICCVLLSFVCCEDGQGMQRVIGLLCYGMVSLIGYVYALNANEYDFVVASANNMWRGILMLFAAEIGLVSVYLHLSMNGMRRMALKRKTKE